ncbi:MAG: hypothetical protein AAB438_01775, partial [Patescibacteria group bacterium]
MSKRKLIILIIIVLLITLLAWGYSTIYKKDNTPTDGGSVGGTNFISDFFNLIKSKTGDNTTDGENPGNTDVSNNQQSETIKEKKKLTKISSNPVAGFTVFLKERFKNVPDVIPGENPDNINLEPVAPATEFIPSVRYVDRATGNIFQTFADKIKEQKFSETVVPIVYEAFFGNNGDSV